MYLLQNMKIIYEAKCASSQRQRIGMSIILDTLSLTSPDNWSNISSKFSKKKLESMIKLKFASPPVRYLKYNSVHLKRRRVYILGENSRSILFIYYNRWNLNDITFNCCLLHLVTSGTITNKKLTKTSQELQMLSSVTLDCQATKIVMNAGSQSSEL